MTLKNTIKSILPERLSSIIPERHYLIPYIFKNGRANPPTEVFFEITYKCNLKCLMCPQATDFNKDDSTLKTLGKNNKELTTKETLKMIRQAAAMGVKRFSISGGELFLRSDVIEILSEIKKNGMLCYIISNGGLMNEKDAEKIVEMGLDLISFSLDGTEDIHNKIRKNKHQFQDLLSAVRMIQSEKKKRGKILPAITLNMTISALNSDQLSEMVDIAAREKVDLNYGLIFYSSQDMETRTKEMYPADAGNIIDQDDQNIPTWVREIDAKTVAKNIKEAEEKAAKMGISLKVTPNLREPEDLHRRYYDDNHAYVHHCFYPWYGVRINPYGDVFPCVMTVKIGNIRENNFDDLLWNNEVFVKFRKELRRVGIWPKCTKCCMLINEKWDKIPKLKWYWNH